MLSLCLKQGRNNVTRLYSVSLKNKNLFRQQAYVNGKWIDGTSKKTTNVIGMSKDTRYSHNTDPATGKTIGTIPDMNKVDTAVAIDAAEQALPEWRSKTAKVFRSHILTFRNVVNSYVNGTT
jgi:acyl-CoA reductase-like NAD-dependent aldehyde dehydrogenase